MNPDKFSLVCIILAAMIVLTNIALHCFFPVQHWGTTHDLEVLETERPGRK